MDESAALSPERYLDVRALLLSWKGADKAFYEQLVLLKDVLQDEYRFNVEDWAIPHNDPFFQLNGRLYQFLQSDNYDTLLIVYYGGHGSTDADRNALWMCYDRADSPRLSWSSLQPLFFNKKSDILMIFDCCSAGSAVCAPGEGVMEGVFASGVGGRTPLSGKNTFTRNLVDRLRRPDCFTQGVTAYRLYHDLAQNFKLSNNSTRQHGVSPQYLRLAERKDEFRTIQLARLPSFHTAKEMSGTSVPSVVTGRAMSFATARSTPTLEIIDMTQDDERMQLPNVSRISSARSPSMAKMMNSDAYSIRHSVFRGCDRVSDQSLPWLGQADRSPADRATNFPWNLLVGRKAPLTPRTWANYGGETPTSPGNLGIQGSIPDPGTVNEIDATISVNEDVDFPQDVPQNRRLMDDLLSKRSTPLPALKFDSVSSGYGDAMSAVKEYNYNVWSRNSGALIIKANKGLSAARRVFLEVRSIQTSGVLFISAAPLEDSLDTVLASIEGPPDTPYEGGIFWISVEFEPINPAAPPALRFQTKMYHPNIDCDGNLYADYETWWNNQNLKRYMNFMANAGTTGAWFSERASNRFSLGALLRALCSLLTSPNIQDPLVPEIAEKYIRDYAGYCEIAKLYTTKYAKAERPSAAAINLTRHSFSKGNWTECQIKSQSTMSSTITPTARVNTLSIASSRLKQWELERRFNAEEPESERSLFPHVKGLFEEFKSGVQSEVKSELRSELESALSRTNTPRLRRKRNEENGGKAVKLLPNRHNTKETKGNLSNIYTPKLRLKRGDRITITKEVEAAVGNESNGKKVMALLLHQKGDQITITKEVVKATAGN